MKNVNAIKTVFRNNSYLFLALVIAFLVLVLATWLPNLELAINVFGNPKFSFAQKSVFAFRLTTSAATNFTWFSALYTVVIALLFGMDVAMVDYVERHSKKTRVGGILILACAGCGTLLLGPLLQFAGAADFMAALPLTGGEFGILGVVILAWSLRLIGKKIHGRQ